VDPDLDYSDGRIAGAGISKLNQFATNYLNNGKRFFLAVGLQKPHLPFTSPKSFWDLYDPAEIDLAGYDGSRTPPTGGLAFTNATYEIGSYEDLIPPLRRLTPGV
jgi:iduronate 2-sulfatase